MWTKACRKRFARDERGNVAIISGMILVPILALIGLVIDFRITDNSKDMTQHTLDAAVLAGGKILMSGGSASAAQAEVSDFVSDLINGGQRGLTCSVVTNQALTSNLSVYGRLRCRQTLSFSAIIDRRTLDFVVESRARFDQNADGCILALGPSTGYGISAWGNSSVNVSGCAMISNVTNNNSVQVGGSGQITAGCVYAAGGVQGSAITTTQCNAPVENSPAVADPYAYLAAPSGFGAMPCKSVEKVDKNTDRMPPGRYCGAISLKNRTLLQDGGVYIIDANGVNQGGLRTLSQHVTIEGTNVTLIFVNDAQLENTNGGTIDLTAPSAGPYAGIAIFTDPATTTPGANVKINGNAASRIKGAVYMPKSHLTYTGGASLTDGCTQIVARTVEFTGNSKVFTNCAGTGVKEFGPADELFLDM